MKFIRIKFYFITLLLVWVFSLYGYSQTIAKSALVEENSDSQASANPTPTPKKKPKPKPKPTPKEVEVRADSVSIENLTEETEEPVKTSEKAIVTEAKVNVSLCVTEGKIKVTGWERNEVRVFVAEGSAIGFKVRQKDKSSEKPILLDIINPNSKSEKPCLTGDDIEIDIPKSATLEFEGQESEASFDSFYKAKIENDSGNINLSNIENGVEARTYEGIVTLDKIKGNINVYSANGGIIAYNTSPAEISDSFKARTESGVINLQNISHLRLEANSISGAIRYSGEILSGGSYVFSTTNGSVLLNIPSNTSCKLNAIYGYGTFNSEITFKVLTDDKTSSVKRTVVQMGAGEADVSIKTLNSSIKIKPLKK